MKNIIIFFSYLLLVQSLFGMENNSPSWYDMGNNLVISASEYAIHAQRSASLTLTSCMDKKREMFASGANCDEAKRTRETCNRIVPKIKKLQVGSKDHEDFQLYKRRIIYALDIVEDLSLRSQEGKTSNDQDLEYMITFYPYLKELLKAPIEGIENYLKEKSAHLEQVASKAKIVLPPSDDLETKNKKEEKK